MGTVELVCIVAAFLIGSLVGFEIGAIWVVFLQEQIYRRRIGRREYQRFLRQSINQNLKRLTDEKGE